MNRNDSYGGLLRAASFFVVVVIAISGCGSAGLEVVDNTGLPLRDATAQELVTQVNRDGNAVTALKGKLGMGLQKGLDEDVRRCSGMLLAKGVHERGLYLKGYKRLMPTLFTMASDGDEFWFHIPRDNVVYTGPVDFSWSGDDTLEMYLDAGDLFRALFLRPVDISSVVDLDVEDSVYCVTVHVGGVKSRKLWIERKRFNVVRELYYDGNGIEQLEIQRRRYVDLGGRLYPASLVLRDVVSGGSVFLDFESIILDPDNVPAEAFHFDVPNGVDVRRVDNKRVET